MKTLIYSFIALIICIFSVANLSAQVIQINQTFSSDTLITPFPSSVPVYSFSFSGGVNLLSDSSLERVRTTTLKPGLYVIELWKEQNRIAFTKLILSK